MHERVRQVCQDLVDALAQHPGLSLVVVGHSMGAGTGALLTLLLRSQPPVPALATTRCFAYGAPSCTSREVRRTVPSGPVLCSARRVFGLTVTLAGWFQPNPRRVVWPLKVGGINHVFPLVCREVQSGLVTWLRAVCYCIYPDTFTLPN